MKARYSVDTVSSYIIKYSDEHFGGVSNLRLQKLLYFVQVEFIKTFNEAAFEEEIEAWGFGPVVPEIYRKYKVFGRGNVVNNQDCIYNFPDPIFDNHKNDKDIDVKDQEIINQVLEKAKDIPTAELVRISHVQDPWKNAYNGDKSANAIITKDSIHEYFVG